MKFPSLSQWRSNPILYLSQKSQFSPIINERSYFKRINSNILIIQDGFNFIFIIKCPFLINKTNFCLTSKFDWTKSQSNGFSYFKVSFLYQAKQIVQCSNCKRKKSCVGLTPPACRCNPTRWGYIDNWKKFYKVNFLP